jgi:hypothetical protein
VHTWKAHERRSSVGLLVMTIIDNNDNIFSTQNQERDR